MTLPAPHYSEADLERLVAARTADLNELLGHMTTCWDEERRLLARKLHDSLGSSMTALTMHLALLGQQMPKEKVLQDRAAQMKHVLATIINTNRDMQLALWNDKLEFLGIKAAITELVTQFGRAHGIVARVSLPDEDDAYPRALNVALLRTAEEGLRNVLAHARASEVDVILDDDGDAVMLTVRDNGVGAGIAAGARLETAPRADGNGCHGLRLLRERASYLGGALSIAPAAATGTVLTISLPKTAPTPTP